MKKMKPVSDTAIFNVREAKNHSPKAMLLFLVKHNYEVILFWTDSLPILLILTTK